MNDEPRKPQQVCTTGNGKPAVPQPHPADYPGVPEEAFTYIDKHCDQEELSSGKVIERFEW